MFLRKKSSSDFLIPKALWDKFVIQNHVINVLTEWTNNMHFVSSILEGIQQQFCDI